MRKGFFLSFFILSSVQVLSVLALEDLHKLEDQNLKVSKHLTIVQGKKGPNGREHMNDDAQEFAAKHYAVFPEKTQRGKGSYGGADLVHHPPTKSNAVSVLQRPSVLIPTITVCISLFFLPVFPLLIV